MAVLPLRGQKNQLPSFQTYPLYRLIALYSRATLWGLAIRRVPAHVMQVYRLRRGGGGRGRAWVGRKAVSCLYDPRSTGREPKASRAFCLAPPSRVYVCYAMRSKPQVRERGNKP